MSVETQNQQNSEESDNRALLDDTQDDGPPPLILDVESVVSEEMEKGEHETKGKYLRDYYLTISHNLYCYKIKKAVNVKIYDSPFIDGF